MIIMHIDANSAYLSWSAVAMLEKGYTIDLRTIPAVIAGNPENRHGIILAKSIPCKSAGIVTGESLFEAKQKCQNLTVIPPDYDLYMSCSDAMFSILSEYSPQIQRYSVDECFLDYTASQSRFGDPVVMAHEIKERVKRELGFTVNIGVSSNKLLAKMASELQKPDRVHTLWPWEIKDKMWSLPVRDLFMVGRATETKLRRININTIGDLASSDPLHMRALLGSRGQLVWEYANGIDETAVIPNSQIVQKGLGNSTTTAYDIVDREEAQKVLLSLVERTSMRLRRLGRMTSLISVSVKTDGFLRYSHQIQLSSAIDMTSEIYRYICELFDQCWKGEPIRHLGVAVSDLSNGEIQQISLFEKTNLEREKRLDKTIDGIRKRYGDRALIRGTFTNGGVDPLQGGTNDGDYIMMGGYGCEDPSRAH